MGQAAVAGVMVAGGALNAYATLKEGEASAAQLEFRARMARLQAGDTEKRGESDAARVRMEGSRAIGQARADIGASGLEMSGTPAASLADIRQFSELDALMVRTNAARDAWGLRAEAAGMESAAKQTRKQSYLGAAGSFLGGAAQAGSFYKGGK